MARIRPTLHEMALNNVYARESWARRSPRMERVLLVLVVASCGLFLAAVWLGTDATTALFRHI